MKLSFLTKTPSQVDGQFLGKFVKIDGEYWLIEEVKSNEYQTVTDYTFVLRRSFRIIVDPDQVARTLELVDLAYSGITLEK